jgi:hypothetical protein
LLIKIEDSVVSLFYKIIINTYCTIFSINHDDDDDEEEEEEEEEEEDDDDNNLGDK